MVLERGGNFTLTGSPVSLTYYFSKMGGLSPAEEASIVNDVNVGVGDQGGSVVGGVQIQKLVDGGLTGASIWGITLTIIGIIGIAACTFFAIACVGGAIVLAVIGAITALLGIFLGGEAQQDALSLLQVKQKDDIITEAEARACAPGGPCVVGCNPVCVQTYVNGHVAAVNALQDTLLKDITKLIITGAIVIAGLGLMYWGYKEYSKK